MKHINKWHMRGVPVLPAIYGESLSYMEVQGKMQYQINGLIDNQEEFDERLDTAEGDIEALEGRMDTTEGDIDSLEERMGTAEGDIDAVEERMGTAEGDIDALEGRIDTAEGDIDALEGRMDTAEGDIDALEGRMDTAEGDIDALEIRVEAVENGIPRNYPVVIDSIDIADGESKVIGYVDLHTGVDRVSSLFTCTLNYEVRVTGGSSFGTVTVDIRVDGVSAGEFEFTYFNGGMHNESMIVPVDMRYAGNHIVDIVVSADDCTLA